MLHRLLYCGRIRSSWMGLGRLATTDQHGVLCRNRRLMDNPEDACGVLPCQGYENNVSRVTLNPLRRFMDERPFG